MAGPDDDDENDDNQNDRPAWPRPLKMYMTMMTNDYNDDNQPAWPRRGGQCDGCSDNRRCRCPTPPKPDHHHLIAIRLNQKAIIAASDLNQFFFTQKRRCNF